MLGRGVLIGTLVFLGDAFWTAGLGSLDATGGKLVASTGMLVMGKLVSDSRCMSLGKLSCTTSKPF